MKPLEALGASSDLPSLLTSGKPAEVEAALALAEEAPSAGALHKAALDFAKAAWALREGRLETARVGFEDAATAFESAGEAEAAQIARIESAVTRARRGRRETALEAAAIVAPLETEGASAEVRARATLAHGTALRVLGDASKAQACFARVLELSRELPDVRSMALNSLGTLCVSLAAFGAAETLCEHAAELCRMKKDVVGEAIAMGQLGAASLGLGDLVAARKFLSRQEWLSAQVGDVFGRTRALVWLAEVALEAGRADDAAMLATRALESANSVSPPLSTFGAYADRVLGRARVALGEPAGREDIARACATFASQRLPLGQALASRDVALASDPLDRDRALAALASLAALGLPERIAEVMPQLGAPAELELAIVAPSARRLEPLEARLVYDEPEALASVAEVRSAARKNLSRLAVFALSESGLWIAAVATDARVGASVLVDDPQVACACVGGFPGVHLLAWPASAPADVVASDLAIVRQRAAGAVRVALSFGASSRVRSPGFGGGLGPALENVEASSVIRSLDGVDAGSVRIVASGDRNEPATAALRRAGFIVAAD